MMCVGLSLYAQTGTLKAVVIDKGQGEKLPFVKAILTGGTTDIYAMTDFEGNVQFNSLAPGTYSLELKFVGMETINVEGIIVKANKITILGEQMMTSQMRCCQTISCCYLIQIPYSQEDKEAGLNLKPSN